jgi:CRP-like cAMP-binding protein
MAALTSGDLDIVSRIAVFRGLRPATVERLVRSAAAMTLAHGAVLFRQGEPGTAFFIVVDGWIKLYRIAPSGEETVLHVLARGESFAEAVAFTNGRYPAMAEAVSAARIVQIPADHVVRCIREEPDIALAMIASTSTHLHRLVQQVEQLKVQNGAQRVADFLSSLCPSSEGACTIVLPYDKALIAGRLGLKPESLSRAFARLKAVGVDVDASHVTIRDIGKLRRIAADDRSAMRDTLRHAWSSQARTAADRAP